VRLSIRANYKFAAILLFLLLGNHRSVHVTLSVRRRAASFKSGYRKQTDYRKVQEPIPALLVRRRQPWESIFFR
jgi:hypothetical protein